MEPLKLTVLRDEAITVRCMAPSEIHIKAYVRAVGGYPSKLQSPPSEEEGELHSPTDNPHPSRETPWHLQAELGNLADCELHQLVEDLCQEIAHCELHAPPRSPPPMPWGHQSGSGNPNKDDQEVTFLRGGRWVPLGQPSPSPSPAQPDGGWVPQEPPPQPQIPAQPNPDMGCLINTLALGLCLGTPRINTFRGKAMPGKTKLLFEQWNHEVQCVKDHYPESVLGEHCEVP